MPVGWATMALTSHAWSIFAAGLLVSHGPAFAESVVIKDAYVLGYNMPSVEFIGPAQTASELEAAFAGPEDTAAFLTIKADKIIIPEIVEPSADENIAPRIAVKNLIAEGYDKGRIAVLKTEKISGAGYDLTSDAWSIASTLFEKVEIGPLLQHISANNMSLAQAYSGNSSAYEPMADRSLFSGIKVAMPTLYAELGKSEELVVASAEVLASDYAGTFPRKLNLQIKGASYFGQPANESTESALLRLPYDIALTWLYDEKAKQMAVPNLSISTPSMGTALAQFTLTNVDLPALQGSETEMVSSWLGASIADASLTIEDRGVSEAIFTVLGASKAKTAAEARSEGIEITRALLPTLLSGAPNSGAIVETLAAFLKDGGKIKLEAKAKNGPLGAADFIAIEGPFDLLPKLDLVVSNP
jgi:hypothetical protein